jgi:cell division GTPase FtsZ
VGKIKKSVVGEIKMSKKSVKKRKTVKAKSGSKAKASHKVKVKAKAKPKTKAKAKSKAKPKVTHKVVASKHPTAKKRVTPKAKATKKSPAWKVKATKKTVASKRPTAKKRVTPQAKATRKPAKKVAQRRSLVNAKGEFDFNAFLLPTLALEQYEPNFEEESGVVDKIHGSTRYAWIGSGQCGGRLVKSFHELGYKKVLAVNTTHHDLDLLDIPQSQKFLMDIGEKGAGKDMERGKEAVQQYQQEILHLTRQTFGSQVDHIMVCFGAGGGTGSGSVVGLIEIAKRYARYIGLNNPNKNVGVVMTLPTVGEASSPLVAENAYKVAWELSQMAAAGKISPLIIVDNDKINKMYPKMTVKSFWPTINNTVASLFDIFNRLSSFSSQYTSFDSVDYRSIMESGGCSIMGLTKVTKFSDKFAISEAVKKNLEKTLLASGFDLPTAKVAGCIAVGGRKLMANVKGLQDNIDYAFDVLSEITGKATIHRGVYEDGKNSLRVYTIIGGLEAPTERLEELRSHTTIEVR